MAEKKVGSDNLLNEVINSDHAALQEMLDLKCPINVVGTCGEAPLHIAIYKKDMKMLDMLMAAGADIMFRNSNGDSAVHVAARMGMDKLVEMLYRTASELNKKRLFLQAKNKEGFTPLDIALQKVNVLELDLTRKYRSWDSETGTTLDEEAGPMQSGRVRCGKFLQEKTELDILNKQTGSVLEMVAQNNDFQKTAGVLRGRQYPSSLSRIYYSELDYPARLDSNAWIDSDKKFFLDYLPGVRKVVTKLHAVDFVTRTVRSGFSNAQLVIRRGEINSYIQEQANLQRSATAPEIPPEPAVDERNLASVELLRRKAKGRKDFSLRDDSDEYRTYYKNEDHAPKSVEELRKELSARDEKKISAKHALDAYNRAPMRPIFSQGLQCEGSGLGKVDEGLFSVGNSHGQPKHDFGNSDAIDPRFKKPRNIPVDDRNSAQTRVLWAIDQHAVDAMNEVKKETLDAFAERMEQARKETDEYNAHMTVSVKYKI